MRKLTKEEFVERARKIHGDKYDYSKVEYVDIDTDVLIICPIHGEFKQTPYKHLKGRGCQKCGGTEKLTLEEFLKRAREVHGDKYDYSKVEYNGAKEQVKIICPIHGEFQQTPYNHLKGHGCDKCAHDKLGLSKRRKLEEFIEMAKKVHGDKYDYSRVIYKCGTKNVTIICPKHGEFQQTPNKHLNGSGCPKCNSSHLENDIRNFLKSNNIEFIEQKRFGWLKSQSLDFFIPSKNIAIECQGLQHFKPIDYFGGEKYFSTLLKRDNNKLKLCEENNIKVLYYSDLHIDYPYKVYENKDDLFDKINSL